MGNIKKKILKTQTLTFQTLYCSLKSWLPLLNALYYLQSYATSYFIFNKNNIKTMQTF